MHEHRTDGHRIDEHRINQVRKQLPALLSQTYSDIRHAASLLEAKAARCPNSSEAQAHRVLVMADHSIIRWLIDGGEQVGVELPALQAQVNP